MRMRMRLAWKKSQKTLDTSKRLHQYQTWSTWSVGKGSLGLRTRKRAGVSGDIYIYIYIYIYINMKFCIIISKVIFKVRNTVAQTCHFIKHLLHDFKNICSTILQFAPRLYIYICPVYVGAVVKPPPPPPLYLREILQCPSHLVFGLFKLEKVLMYFLETLQVRAPCHGGVLYSFWYWWN